MSLPIPFFSLQRHVATLEKEISQTLQSVISSQQFIGGRFVETFEKELAQYTGADYAIGCNSGTDALFMALSVLNVNAQSLILSTPFSFIASSSEARRLGADIVFIDIEPESFNINPLLLREWLTKETQILEKKTIHTKTGRPVEGIVTVDLFGQCADYDEIKAIAQEWHLWIIEDACQAIGSSYKGQKAGILGDIAAFSFYPTKNLGAFGDGGAVTTNNPFYAEKIKQMRNHGRASHYNYESLGINSRLDGIQAALLSLKLTHLDRYNARRREIAERYTKAFSGFDLIKTPAERFKGHVFHQYSLRLRNHDGTSLQKEFMNFLTENSIDTRVFYPQPLDEIWFIAPQKPFATACPEAHRAATEVVALPIWPELTDAEVTKICHTVEQFCINYQPQAALKPNLTL